VTRFGIVLPRRTASREDLLDPVRVAEEAGLDSVWVSDHLWGRDPDAPTFEAWTALTMVAASTRRLELGTLVLRATLRLPRVLAAMAATLSKVAPGRLVVGLGAGDVANRDEDVASGYPTPPRRRRVEAVAESIEALHRHAPGVRVWVGGTGDDLLDLAAGADGWNQWGSPEAFADHRSRLVNRCDPGRLPEISWAGLDPGPQGVRDLVAAGADHVIVAVGARTYRERIDALARVREG
jgi:alkanesulfonate monooxygenase SsuD/methylene tetrahydromethanopterin reductase-like flavin-dependent oxidoreductase (luciferase family)